MNLFYREKGDPDLPPLIILHGLWGSGDNWLTVADLLAEHFHVILPDFRNHGNSLHSDSFNYKLLCEDIEKFTDQLRLTQKPFIAGHSMGGKVAMLLLLKRNGFARKSAVIDIAPKTYLLQANHLHTQLLDFISNFPIASYEKRTEIQTQIRTSFPCEETICQILFKNLRKTNSGINWKINWQAIRNNLQELTSWPVTDFPVYPHPILFIKGDHSDYILEDDFSRICSYFPQAILQHIPQATHQIHADQPHLLAQALTRFFLNKEV